jgi:hypothetical protein
VDKVKAFGSSARQAVIATAYADYDIQCVSVSVIGKNLNLVKNMPLEMPDFSYIAPNWDELDLCILWTIFSSQAFQFTHYHQAGGYSKSFFRGYTGSAAVLMMIKECWPITDNINKQKLSLLFQTLPMHTERLLLLDELISKYEFLVDQVKKIISATKDGVVTCTLAKQLSLRFPLNFSDQYLKKAQLAVSAIAWSIKDKPNDFNISDLTAFADYEVPRVLRHYGLISYNNAISNAINIGIEIPKDSHTEKALRAATILAIEKISKETGRSAAQIDNLLWNMQNDIPNVPKHRTLTTSY